MQNGTNKEKKLRIKLATAILLSGDPGEAALGLGAGLSRTACDASGLAHLRQYFRPAGFSSEQWGQIMEISREGMLKGYHH